MMLPTPDPRVRSDVELRSLEFGDAEELYLEVANNRDYLRQWLPWVDGVTSPADVAKFIELSQEQRRQNRAFQLGVRVDGRLCGAIGLHTVDWTQRSTSLGYWLSAEQQGRGVMTASCAHVIAHLFDALELHRVVIRCALENRRSRAIPERLGFHQEGILKDAEWLYDHFVDLATYARLQND